ncbi:MAG: hypothetical protein OTI35_05295 [Sulfitobacter sp.]|nr:hypothetical protein [Sulfitobacter sp.]
MCRSGLGLAAWRLAIDPILGFAGMVDAASEFIGGQIKVEAARKIKLGYEIKTTACCKGENPIDVIYLVSDKSGQRQSFNMFLEGVYQLC